MWIKTPKSQLASSNHKVMLFKPRTKFRQLLLDQQDPFMDHRLHSERLTHPGMTRTSSLIDVDVCYHTHLKSVYSLPVILLRSVYSPPAILLRSV